jgi:hypothetical protein
VEVEEHIILDGEDLFTPKLPDDKKSFVAEKVEEFNLDLKDASEEDVSEFEMLEVSRPMMNPQLAREEPSFSVIDARDYTAFNKSRLAKKGSFNQTFTPADATAAILEDIQQHNEFHRKKIPSMMTHKSPHQSFPKQR